MNRDQAKRPMVDTLFLLALFGVFTICLLFVVLFGARIYHRIVIDMEDHTFTRTTQAYITEKIHQQDCRKAPEIFTTPEGYTGLKLTQLVEDKPYYTYLYQSKESLMEVTYAQEASFDIAGGTPILTLDSFSVEETSPGLFRFEISRKSDASSSDETISFYVAVRSNTGGNDHE